MVANKLKKNITLILSVALALLISFIIIFFVSDEPLYAIKAFIVGPFSTSRRLGNLIEKTIPLIFTGLAASIMFQAKQFSLIADGSFVIGGLAGTILALNLRLSPIATIPIILVLSAIAGGLCAVIPAYLKSRWDTNEFVVSMMMNSILQLFAAYVLLNIIRDPESGFVASFLIPDQYHLSILFSGTRIHFGLIIAMIVTILAYILIYKTKLGYSIRMVGFNPNFAFYSGVKLSLIIFIVQIIGGSISGLGGAVEILGMYDRFQWQTSPGLGFDGMTVAILASNNPIFVPIGALFIAYIRTGADVMARTSQVPNEMVYIIQGLVMIFVTANLLVNLFKDRKIRCKMDTRLTNSVSKGGSHDTAI
ncbi:ABC-type uncharacterized transport system,permease component [[Clostridium] ultunense Esp]|uniref:ABC-type uncharacterized transport system,permease component n=1 Tax=[Clostridium] ultunense Esp TaxID=1288971 RepID=M1ZE93_9FIRM|nr:ABC transporter permease [Schnuerera ultunensis]CCQ96976.1 ABC-type uncharacterized transport system,permease component [[Clostridium] ultunense Esp]SHD76467.1 ABC-type uncharacterized transport system,permease component [[Clostridium] ultunense Esp]